jgi:hypothetical protein
MRGKEGDPDEKVEKQQRRYDPDGPPAHFAGHGGGRGDPDGCRQRRPPHEKLFAAVWLMQRFNWVVTPELIRDSIAGDSYERIMTETHTALKDAEGNITGYTVSRKAKVTDPPKGIMGEWLSACIENGNDNNEYASLKAFNDTIEVNLKINDDTSLRTVKAAFSAQKDGKIQVQLYLKPEEGKTDDCRMTLTMQGTLTKAEESESYSSEDVDSYIYKTTVKWEPQRITKGIEVTGP